MWSADEGRRRAGFTLIEVMVALVLAVLLGGVIFQVLRGESRFVTVQSARQEVQQNARGALEILASELRAAQSFGLVNANANSITFLLPRAWGISCGGGSAVQATALFPDQADPGVMFTINNASGMMGNIGTLDIPNWSGNPNAGNMGSVTAVANIDLSAAGNACAAIRPTGANAGVIRGMTMTGTNLPIVPQGNQLYLYQWVQYDVAQTNGEWWIRRSFGVANNGNPQPLAGPLTGSTGLAFTYWNAAGNALAVPGNNAALLQQVARIGITVSAASRSQGRTNLTDTQSASVQMRN
ncbi:MAG: prepilin-type N-terminal cleavage/methylation domain-containing protein [Gemmatimonadetes bacterium]|nr:prepilin-type N-terminal cleavage/methylation domain-containing protein [Gemmatimonadota bacterium]